ncbi:MAG: tRNA pseudouridine(38-40) synthase TruA [Chloroflexi bacterium]|nr:MAG: tRNA pseudouridine(38-40) synthase TruA [Chloroflexota bacterium]
MGANIKLVVEYEGTRFHGWQAQSGSTATVERTLATALEQLTGESPVLIAAGRTDAGVHALGQCVNFHLDSGFPVAELPGALNSRLGPDVVVRSAEIVADSFHARYSARLRRYAYRIRRAIRRGAYERQYAWSVPGRLDVSAMRDAGKRLEGRHDFRAFGRSPRPGGHTVREIRQVSVEENGEWLTIAVAADAFLYGMMRRIAGALVEVGRGRRPLDWIDHLLAGNATGLRPAPPFGLVQVAVDY